MKKNATIRAMLPCSEYDIERIESWLTDMAGEGWHLKSKGFFYHFERGEPKAVRYRLQPKKYGEDTQPDHNLQELCREYGWEYSARLVHFFIYRTEDPNARELNTEPVVYASAVRRMMWQYLLSWTLSMLILVNPFSGTFLEPYRQLVVFGPFLTVGYWLFIAAHVVSLVVHMIHILRHYRKLKANKPLEHNKPWRKGAKARRLGVLLLKGAYVAFLILFFATWIGKATMLEKLYVAEYEGDPPVVTISDLSPEGSYTQENFLDYNMYSELSSLCAPAMLEWSEHGKLVTPEGEVYSGAISVTYYETSEQWIARGLARELWRKAQKEKHFQQIELDLDADFVGAYSAVGSHVVIRQGNVVVEAFIGVMHDDEYMLREWAQLMLEKMKT